MPRQRKKVYGSGSVYPRKDGRWVASFMVEETGKRKYLYADSQKEAEALLQKALREQEQGTLATGPKQKLADHLNWWLEEVKRPKLRPTSYRRYRIALDKHILPAIGNVPLQKLTTQMVQTFYNSKIKERQSPSSIHTMHKVLHNALAYAVKVRLITHNPSENVSLPKQTKRKVKPLTLEQARHLLKVAEGSHLEMLVTLALTTGLRMGELVTLRWEDINFEQYSIYVHRTGMYPGKSGFIEGDPKTEASERTIPISKLLCERLKRHKASQNELRLKAGSAWKNLNLVCCNSTNGGFLIAANVRTSIYRLLDKAGLPRMHIHDLRHTASTLMRSMGVDIKVVQERLGHSNLDMTWDYSHVFSSQQAEAAEKMDSLFQ